MDSLNIEMPLVSQCAVHECTYNLNNNCHAKAITIGDGSHPGCDTFFSLDEHCKEQNRQAGVGACKVNDCIHNEDFECMARDINVGFSGNDINCLTFKAS